MPYGQRFWPKFPDLEFPAGRIKVVTFVPVRVF